MITKSVNDLEQLIANVKNNKDVLGDDFCAEVGKAADNFMKELSESVAQNILHRLREKTPSNESLQAIITALPTVLSVKNERDQIPIQQAYRSAKSVPYVGLLAKQGIKYNVGGNGKRGGLLLDDPAKKGHRTALFCLATFQNESNPSKSDQVYTMVLKELREEGLLSAQEIRNHDVLWWACNEATPLRFDCLSDWDPEGLKVIRKDRPLFHSVVERGKPTRMSLFLKASIKYFPNELGLLFQRDNEGITTFQKSIGKHGKEDTFKVICKCIPQDTKLPVLHHVVKHAPHYLHDFMRLYPHAVYLKNEEGDKRSYFQARLAGGNVTYEKDLQFLTGMSPDQVEMVDPVTGLYPFMVAASGDVCDLDTVYYLMRRGPKLVYEVPKSTVTARENRKRRSGPGMQGTAKKANPSVPSLWKG